MIPSLRVTWRLFRRRGASNWRMLAILALGMLIASTLLAAAPIYSRTMADLGLTYTIRQNLRAQSPTTVQFRDMGLQSEEGKRTRAAVEKRIQERLGWFEASQSRVLKVGRFPVTQGDAEPGQLAALGQLESVSGYESHVDVTQGRLPQRTGPDKPIEVAMSTRAALAAKLKPGDSFFLVENFDTCEREVPPEGAPPPPPCNPSAILGYRMPAQLVGIVEPQKGSDGWWVGPTDSFFAPYTLLADGGPVTPMLATEDSLLLDFGGRFPGYRTEIAWHVFIQPEKLTRSNFHRAHDDIKGLFGDFEPQGGYAFNSLTGVLEQFGDSLDYQQVPLTILLLQISAVALFYVLLMALALVEQQGGEIALLRSRGATSFQVMALYIFEGLTVGVPILLGAPFVAAAATALLGFTPIFGDVGGKALLPVTMMPSAFALAGAGVLLSLFAVGVPAYITARRSAVSQRRAESRPGRSLVQRYYLDLVVAGVALMLLWELSERGSAFTPSASGGVSSDPVLLASPALVVVAAGAIVLRVYPILLRIAGRFITRDSGPSVAVGLWQVLRRPGQYLRLTLLVMMAIAVGAFAASYASTADRSAEDRAAYQAGVEYRATSADASALGTYGATVDATLAKIPGVASASAAIRTKGVPATAGQSGRTVQVLGVDPAAAIDRLWFREDFAGRSLGELMNQLGPSQELHGKPLGGDPAYIGVWVNPGAARDQTTLWARVRDSEHSYAILELGQLDFVGWRELKAEVHRAIGPTIVGPITLVSLAITEPSNRNSTTTAPVYIDDIETFDSAGAATVVEGFESGFAWSSFLLRTPNQDSFVASTDQPHSGRSAGKLTLRPGSTGEGRGIYPVGADIPLPVIASDSFLSAAGTAKGGTATILIGDVIVPVRIMDTFHLFPTLQTADGPAVVFNRGQLISWLNYPMSAGHLPDLNEAWLTLKPGTDRDALETLLKGNDYGLNIISDRQKNLELVSQNPLIAAGGSGILMISFVATLILVGAALLVSLWLAVQRRKTEFAVLRALGLSRRQVLRTLALEFALVGVVGIVTGAYLGLLVGRRMLSFLNVTESGDHVEPGFILQTDWLVVIAGGGAIVIVFAVALGLAVRLVSRISGAQALRTE